MFLFLCVVDTVTVANRPPDFHLLLLSHCKFQCSERRVDNEEKCKHMLSLVSSLKYKEIVVIIIIILYIHSPVLLAKLCRFVFW